MLNYTKRPPRAFNPIRKEDSDYSTWLHNEVARWARILCKRQGEESTVCDSVRSTAMVLIAKNRRSREVSKR